MDINQSNFRQTRRSYGITLQDIADRCHMSTSSIMNYEQYTGQYTQVRTRDDNAKCIVRALEDLIAEKLEETFPFGSKIERSNSMQTALSYKLHKGYKKAEVVSILKNYCASIDVSINEFCAMCNISHSTLAPYSIKKSPVLREEIILKICEASGLSSDMFDPAKIRPIQNNNTVSSSINQIDTSNNVSSTTLNKEHTELAPIHCDEDMDTVDDLVADPNITTKVTSKKYVCHDGKYYEEYTIIKRVRHILSKDEFMTAVQTQC